MRPISQMREPRPPGVRGPPPKGVRSLTSHPLGLSHLFNLLYSFNSSEAQGTRGASPLSG